MIFYLGTHKPHWLGRVDVPLCVSWHTLSERRSLPRASAPWALDSGAFTELHAHGRWRTPAAVYARDAARFAAEIGQLAFAGIRDWMCEEIVLARTGLSIAEHQARTVASFQELRDLAPQVPWLPTLQGWEPEDYLRSWERYEAAGIDLAAAPLVGVGSVCRRQHTRDLARITARLAPLRLHGFGVKTLGLSRLAGRFVSTDSAAWSQHARRRPPLPGCLGHKNCANCLRYALLWRDGALARRSLQEVLPV